MLGYIDYLGVPATAAIAIIAFFFVMQIIGELLELKGKVVPEIWKIRKYFIRKKAEREETEKTLRDVQTLLSDVNAHYSSDNIAKRDDWMRRVTERGALYDESINKITENLNSVTAALTANTKLTEEMFIQNSRDRIIDFATKVADGKTPVSREEYNRIFRVYAKYEAFIADHGMTNGEVDIAHQLINESYEKHMKNHEFIEDTRGH